MAYWTPPVPPRFGDVPFGCGLIFSCQHCGRTQAVSRDGALKAWGEKGIIAEVAARTRCGYGRCKELRRRGHRVEIAPRRTRLGSKTELARLLEAIDAVKPRGQIS